MASAVCATWEQSISYADGQLLPGISFSGGWLTVCHQQVTVQSVQFNTLALLKVLPWLLTSWRRNWSRDVSVVRHFELQIITPGDLQKTPKVAFVSCVSQEAL